jgi:signal transduction histidine kinase
MEVVPTVLVVDDSPDSLDLMKQVLGTAYKVRVAINGDAALKLARQAPPDIVLLDVMMPEMDGYEVCRQLKAEPALAGIPVIFITAMDEVEDEEKGFSVGAVDYITKPISPPLVKARVATHLGIHRQRRELEDARSRAEEGARAKAEFLAIMSHEIRNPLNAILGMVSLLMETKLDTEQSAYLQTVHYAGDALLAILNDVLDYSRIEAGKLVMEKAAFDLHQTLDSVISLMESRSREKSLKLIRRIAADVPVTVTGDSLRLRQVLLNLVSNAIKFTPEGEITVEVSRVKGNRLLFQVTDTGIGIEADALPSLFSDFTQQDASISRRFGGTGLGLSICKRLVALMNGSIEVHSQLGAGSSFRFELPLPEPVTFAAIAKVDEAPPQDAPLNILLAEDNPVSQRVAVAALSNWGHTVTAVSDGAAAVEALTLGCYDLVLMDMRMPVLDGTEATRAIRRLPPPKGNIPVIGLTAGAFDEERDRCYEAGMTDFVTKPFSRAVLLDALRRATQNP